MQRRTLSGLRFQGPGSFGSRASDFGSRKNESKCRTFRVTWVRDLD